MKKMLTVCGLAVSLAAASTAFAKLPAPPATPKPRPRPPRPRRRTAWTGKVEAYQLCQSQDKVAASYRASAEAAGKQLSPPPALPACADPGPFAYSPPATEADRGRGRPFAGRHGSRAAEHQDARGGDESRRRRQ